MVTECEICGNKAVEANGKCGSCNARIRKFERDMKKPIKTYKIPKVSKKLKEALKDYSVLRKEHLADHPDCQVKLIGCQNHRPTNEVHHTKGRKGNLNAKDSFLTTCRHCHSIIHDKLSAAERREKGLLI